MQSRFFFGLIPETEPAETRVDERSPLSFEIPGIVIGNSGRKGG